MQRKAYPVPLIAVMLIALQLSQSAAGLFALMPDAGSTENTLPAWLTNAVICTANGPQQLAESDKPADEPAPLSPHCPLCIISAAQAFTGHALAVAHVALPLPLATGTAYLANASPAALRAGAARSYLSRAPPSAA